MNARRILTLFVVLAVTAASMAQAGPGVGTNKARGIYSGGGWTSQGVARSQAGYRYRAPATYYQAPAVQAAPAPMVAQAPADGRRFSYSPSAAATSSVPCPQGQVTASAPAVDGARRFSYEPAPEATVAPATAPATRAYSSRPSYLGRSGGRPAVERWALPKTDLRKFND